MAKFLVVAAILGLCVSSANANELKGWGPFKFGMTLSQTEKAASTEFYKLTEERISSNITHAVNSNNHVAHFAGMTKLSKDGFSEARLYFGVKTKRLREIELISKARHDDEDKRRVVSACLKFNDQLRKKYGNPSTVDDESAVDSYQYTLKGGRITLVSSTLDLSIISSGLGIKQEFSDTYCSVTFEEQYNPDEEKYSEYTQADNVTHLTCHISSFTGRISKKVSFVVDLANSSVNGEPAQISNSEIRYKNWIISRAGGVSLISEDGRVVATGECQKNTAIY